MTTTIRSRATAWRQLQVDDCATPASRSLMN